MNFLNQDSAANLAWITGLETWLTLSGHNNLGGVADPSAVANGGGTLTGATLSGSSFGLLDVDPTGPGNADVIAFLDGNAVADAAGGFADIAYTASFNNEVLNPFDELNGLATGCRTGTAAVGQWCYQGTANLRGDTVQPVPAPGPLALLAIGMLGLGLATRSRKA